jgi:CDP-2,3-bis-(O-geranylgeranyl)-sn-glycerol synthase
MKPDMNLIEILHFVVPCWLINFGLNTFKHLPGIKKFDKPLDREINFFDRKRLLGPSTTILGFPFALIFGLLAGIIFFDWKIGLILGLSAYFGHALGSFIKRRFGIKPGGFLPLVDHGDFIITAGLILFLLNVITLDIMLYSVLINWIVQPFLCFIGYKLKLRDNSL